MGVFIYWNKFLFYVRSSLILGNTKVPPITFVRCNAKLHSIVCFSNIRRECEIKLGIVTQIL